jgi:acyl-CoA thioester hydrolase
VTHHVHRVAFYETDAMGVVHHANYLRFFEEARVRWLEEHDRPYTYYLEHGLHFAVTRVEIDYRHGARFDDRLEVAVWLERVHGASLRMAYAIGCAGRPVAAGATEHAALGDDGRVRRIPRADRARLLALAVETARTPRSGVAPHG